MPKSLTLGNGNILVGLNKYGLLSDFYFPYVGLENHVGGHYLHRVGIYVDDKLSWLHDAEWQIHIDCEKDTLASFISAVNPALQVELVFNDVVYNEKNIFLRKITITNKNKHKRSIKLFFSHQFELYESHRGDTAYFDPLHHALIHYKGRRVFLINALWKEKQFDDYSTGLFEIEGREGTHVDAQDGVLAQNPIEHGLVDSAMGITVDVAGGKNETVYYWIAVSKQMADVFSLNDYVLQKTPEHLINSTKNFWTAWTTKQNFSFYGLDSDTVNLFKKSLVIVRAHIDNNGAIIASSDSDMLQQGRDTYSYMWPRDGAQTAIALDKAGDTNVARRFFEFCNDVITNDGYFMHKYRSDKSLGSSWHPWIREGTLALPIQEDETALVVHALWQHYLVSKDLEFIENVYNSLIKKAADFMVDYRTSQTGLPKPSYDLWEEKYGIATFTCCSVYAALMSAARFSLMLGKHADTERYTSAAQEVKEAIFTHLYNKEYGGFYKMLTAQGDHLEPDSTCDASTMYGLFKFGVLGVSDKRMTEMVTLVEERLGCKTEVGGIARYEGDNYYRIGDTVTGNPWFITTLWLAQYYIQKATDEDGLTKAKEIFSWTGQHALSSGVLSEQLNPYTGKQISAAPLTWSHAEFIRTIIEYLEKLEVLGICKVCYPLT